MSKEQFIKDVTSLIKYKSIRQDVSKELDSHIEDLKEEYLKEYKQDSKYVEEVVIKQMGDANIIAEEFNKIYRPTFDWVLSLTSIVLLIIGIITANTLRKANIISTYNLEIITIILSLIIGCGVSLLNYKKIEKYSIYIFIGTCIITILSYYFKAISQFYTLILGLYVFSFSGVIRKYGLNIKVISAGIISLICIMLLGKISFLILVISYILIVAFQKEYKINKKICIIAFSCISVFIIGIVLFSSTYSALKLKSYNNPESYKNNEGYIYIHKNEILSNIKIIGESEQQIQGRIGDLQNANIITFIIAKFGMLFTVLVIILFIVLAYRLISNINKVSDYYGKNILIGISVIIIVQIILNVLNGLNIIPYTNVKLPLITFDKATLISDILIISLCVSIYRRKNIVEIDNKVSNVKQKSP